MRLTVLSIVLLTILAGCGFYEPNYVSITTTTLADAPTGLSYSQKLTAANGTAPYHWKIASGALPPGLNLADDGTISGTPTDPTTIPTTTPVYTFTVQVTDSAATPATSTRSLSITTPISTKDTTGKVFARIISFDLSGGIVVNVTNMDIVDHTIQVVVANFNAITGLEISGSELTMTSVTVAAGLTVPFTNTTFNIPPPYNWKIKSVIIIN